MHKTKIHMEMTGLNPGQKWGVAIASLLVLCVSGLLCISLESYLIQKKKELASNAANQMIRQLDRHLNESLFATYALAALIKSGHGDISGFEGLAKEFIAFQPHVASLQLAPGGIVTHIVPLAGNEKAVGHNLLTDEKRNTEARLALQTKKLTLAGPFELRQGGGVAVIGRLPVFLGDGQTGFWGFATALIKMKDFLNSLQIDGLTRQGYAWELWRIQPDTGQIQRIAKSAGALNGEPIDSHLEVPNGRWFLSLTPVEGWRNNARNMLEASASLLLSAISGWLVFIYFRERRVLELSEARYHTLYTSSPVMLHSIDGSNKIISISKLWLETLGYTSEQVIGHDSAEFMSEEARRDWMDSILPELLANGSCANRPLQLLTSDGRLIEVLLTATASKSYQSTMTEMLVVMQDITARKAVERMKSEFVSTVSHELRTPLTAITGSLGLITGGVFGEMPAKVNAMIALAHKNSLRLIHLINDLLDMEKLVAGKMNFDMKSHALMPLLESTIDAIRPYGEGYQVRFVLSARADQARVVVDDLRLQQVLNNFLANAAKFSPEGGQVEVAAHQLAGRVRVEVKDRGPGISAQFRSRIFQKFSQADSSDARQKGGTGLGLAISMEIIERMNGVIGFESEERRGSCFYFELPLDETPMVADQGGHPIAEPPH